MTPFDGELDLSLLPTEMPLTLYRLTTRKYATSLSGLGAALYPGRWNAPGQEAVYTSTECGVCVLERLVHTPKDRIPSDLALMTIQLSGQWQSLTSNIAQDRSTGQLRYAWNSLSGAMDWFAHCVWSENLLALAVPSVIVPVWNVVLYPRAKGFWDHVSLVSVEPFDYDPRLFPMKDPAPHSVI